MLKSAYNLKSFPREKLLDLFNKIGGGKLVRKSSGKI